MEHVAWTKDFLIFLAIAGLAVPLLHRFGVSQVFSFLALGVAVGPFGFGRLGSDYPWLRHVTLDEPQRVAPFAELGVMALLFLIGLELSWSRLAALRKYVLGVGGMQFAVSAAAIGAGAALLGAGPATAVVIGISLAMSSTAVVMQIIEEQGRTATHVGRVALSILLFQDLMVAPVLFTAGFLGSGGSSLADLGWIIAEAVALLVIIAFVGRYALGAVFRLAAQTGSRELIMAISLLVLIGFSILTRASACRRRSAYFSPACCCRRPIPPPGRDRPVAVQGTAGRAVLHQRRHDRRSGVPFQMAAADRGGGRRVDRRQGCDHLSRRAACSVSVARSRPRSRCCWPNPANSHSLRSVWRRGAGCWSPASLSSSTQPSR